MGTPMNLGESIRKIREAIWFCPKCRRITRTQVVRRCDTGGCDGQYRKGLSQGEMQKRTGILRSYLSRVENGHTVPSFATLQRLAGAMGVTLSDFFSPEGALHLSSGSGDSGGEYLRELKNLLPQLSAEQRQQLLDTVKQMARARKA